MARSSRCRYRTIAASTYCLFFYPLDFTFVCPTEIIAFSDRVKDFAGANVQILGVSIDSHFTHLAWRNTARAEGGLGKIEYPLIADLDKSICQAYDVLLPAGIALRGLFLIDKQGVVRHQVVNDLPLGRSVDEAIRHGQGFAVCRIARRSLPRKLAGGQGHDQAESPGQQGVLRIRSTRASSRHSGPAVSACAVARSI